MKEKILTPLLGYAAAEVGNGAVVRFLLQHYQETDDHSLFSLEVNR
jgi:hypothetical protein